MAVLETLKQAVLTAQAVVEVQIQVVVLALTTKVETAEVERLHQLLGHQLHMQAEAVVVLDLPLAQAVQVALVAVVLVVGKQSQELLEQPTEVAVAVAVVQVAQTVAQEVQVL
jgi:hypothetical protein